MRNPIGKFRREKLEEINSKIESFQEKFDLYEKMVEDSKPIIEDVLEKIDVLFQFTVVDDTPPTPAEIKEMEEQQRTAGKEMELMIQNAIIGMWNKPENQKAISTFINGLSGGGGPEDVLQNIQNEDGSLNFAGAIEAWRALKGSAPKMVGATGVPASGTSRGKSTGY